MGSQEPAEGAAFLQGLGLMGHQLLQNRQQPGPVMRQLGIEVLDVVAGRVGAVHRNILRRPGANATWMKRIGQERLRGVAAMAGLANDTTDTPRRRQRRARGA
jgi:hypothetical protein